MRPGIRLTLLYLTLLLAGISGFVTLVSLAQEDAQSENAVTLVSASECGTPLSQLWLSASDACVGKPFGFVCNGGISPTIEPGGAVSNSLATIGSLVETGLITTIRTSSLTSSGDSGGIAWLRVAEPDTLVQFSGLMVGDVRVANVTPEGFTPWQSFIVETIDGETRCEAAPHSSLVLQNLINQAARLVVNGVSLDLRGTVVVQTIGTQTYFTTIAGEVGILHAGVRRDMVAGQEIGLEYAPGDFIRPIQPIGQPGLFRADRVENLPVLLFDRPVQVPQAGYATTQGAINMRTDASLDGAIIVQAPAGERLTVLGRNPAGDWLHVRRSTGETGWMFAELLGGQIGEIDNVYTTTPEPLQRLGELGQLARVIGPNGVVVRSAPDVGFNSIASLGFGSEVNLVARSPYSPWIKIQDNAGMNGWVPLIAMETLAIIESLPIDWDVPPPPEPTRVPGSFGNAFPDPNCYPNC